MQTKICFKKDCVHAGVEQPIENFSKDKSRKDGLVAVCKTCKQNYDNTRNQQPSIKKHKKEYDAIHNREYGKRPEVQIRKKNYQLKYRKEYTQRPEIKPILANKSAIRRAQKLQATPAWTYNELDQFLIEEMYHLRQLRSEATGVEYHVDHIIPLQSDLVCGLHCISNLRLLPAKENISKGNRTWPDIW